MKNLVFCLFLVSACLIPHSADAQSIALKTNLLYLATTTPNISVEKSLGLRSSLDLTVGYNPWTFNDEDNKKAKHILGLAEYRHWFCERFNGSFVGLYGGYSYYNISGVCLPFHSADMADYRYQGWGIGAGVSYGYSWILSTHWNLEATIGVGYAYKNYDKYDCATCGEFKESREAHYLGPTKAALSLIYFIK